MAVDYDLVVVGSSWAGIYAAKNAALLQARVALVTQSNNKYLPNDTLYNQSLGEIGSFNYRLENSPFITSEVQPNLVNLEQTNYWLANINSTVQNINSLSTLAALGVDVIVGHGEFYRLPQLGLQVKQRSLRSRSFLLAVGTNFVPIFDSNNAKSYLTLRDLQNKNLSNLPLNLIIVGSDPTALALTQALARIGKKITLVVESRILPQEDLDISGHILAQLEAEGIEVFTNSVVSQIETINHQKWLQAGNRALVADEIIIADYRQPNTAGLNLAGVGVKCDRRRIYVNSKLQTTNPSIYACGDLIGGYCLQNITRYEVNLILKNSLFLPCYKTNYHTVPWVILTQPNIARVGLSQFQAKQQYPKNIFIIRQYFSNLEQAQITDNLTGLCKLIVRKDGAIIGCSIIGDRAKELITIPALMMQHQIKLDLNPMQGLTSLSIPMVYSGMSEILTRAFNDFYQQKMQQNPRLINRLKTWFSLRKN